MDQTATINEYFEAYLGASPGCLEPGQLLVVPSDRRARPEEGWGYTFAVWAFLLDDRAIVSVRPDLYSAVAYAVCTASSIDFSPTAIRSLLIRSMSGDIQEPGVGHLRMR